MTLTVKQILDGIIEREKGYVDHPNDLGGPTRWGITEKVARASGYQGAMRELPRSLAYEIYLSQYFVEPGFNEVSKHSLSVSVLLTDAGVVCGTRRAATWLQMALNALNRAQRLFPDLVLDGELGPQTIAALKALLEARKQEGEVVLLRALNSLIGHHFIDISLRREANEEFTYGWLLHRVWVI